MEPSVEPSEEPSVESSVEPSEEDEQGIRVISETLQVRRGEKVTVTVQGKPNTTYYISVTYASGHTSEAKGLEPAVSDGNGYVSWSWKIGGSTKPGTSHFVVTDGKTSVRYDFEVVDK